MLLSLTIPKQLMKKLGHTLVKVPVLSEQMTETAPNVSTVLSDLHKTLFFFIRFAQMVRLAVKATGSPSGINAMATLTQSTINVGTLIHEGCLFRSQDALRWTFSLCFVPSNICQGCITRR